VSRGRTPIGRRLEGCHHGNAVAHQARARNRRRQEVPLGLPRDRRGGDRPERPGREQGARPRRALLQGAGRRPRSGGPGPQRRVARAQEGCGLEPRNRQSGTSISPATASRQGNKSPKNLLIFSWNSLVRSGNRFGDFYRKCRDRGMPHGKALKAVARRRLKVIRDEISYSA
jgi:hypothetical protein